MVLRHSSGGKAASQAATALRKEEYCIHCRKTSCFLYLIIYTMRILCSRLSFSLAVLFGKVKTKGMKIVCRREGIGDDESIRKKPVAHAYLQASLPVRCSLYNFSTTVSKLAKIFTVADVPSMFTIVAGMYPERSACASSVTSQHGLPFTSATC